MEVNVTSPKVLQINPSGSKLVANSDPLVKNADRLVQNQIPARKFNFTKKALDSLRPPTNEQRAYFYDEQVRGLTVAVSPAGRKTFVLYRKMNGRPERINLGLYPEMSIEQARGKAEKMNSSIAEGENPRDDQRAMKQENTVGEFFDIYLEHFAKVHNRSWQKHDVHTFNKHLAQWRHLKLSAIRKMDVVNLHAKIGRNSGRYAANRVLELLSAMYNKAIEWEWKGENPAKGVPAFREYKRERFLQPEEFPRFLKSVMEEPNETVRDYVLVSLFTGARRGNVQEMKWEQVNFDHATWRIPVTKHGDSETVTLSPEALAILERRKSAAEWVFPGTGKSGHLVEPKSAWKRILQRADIHDLRLHDLRRTLGSWQAAAGSSLLVIGKSLGHKSSKATEVYARLNLDPIRASVNKATSAMMLAAGANLLEGN
jgi:integrase